MQLYLNQNIFNPNNHQDWNNKIVTNEAAANM